MKALAAMEEIMRTLLVSLFYLTLGGFVICSLADSRNVKDGTEASKIHVYYMEHEIWAEALDRFKKLVSIDSKGAHAELRDVAKILFEGHILTKEWVPLYFRVSQNGTKYLSDIKRVYELEIRMLNAIDAKKYTNQIQHHREKLKSYGESVETFKGKELTPSPQISSKLEESPSTEGDSREKKIEKHLSAFNKLLLTHPDTARSELIAASAIMFNGHPLHEKWAELSFRFSRERQVPILDVISHFEIELQMLTDVGKEKYAERIVHLRQSIEQFNQFINQFEQLGIDPKTKTVKYNYKVGREHLEGD